MKTITIWNCKGGVGKTTITFQLGLSLANLGYKVLYLDMDFQRDLTYLFEKQMNPNMPDISDIHTVSSFCSAIQEFKPNTKVGFIKYSMMNVWFIPGSEKEREYERIDELSEYLDAVDSHFDFCLIDTHPERSSIELNCLYASDFVLVPVLLDEALKNLNLVQTILQNVSAETGKEISFRAVVNGVEDNTEQRTAMQDLLFHHDYPVFDMALSRTVVMQSAKRLRKPLVFHRRKASITVDFEEFVNNLLKVLSAE